MCGKDKTYYNFEAKLLKDLDQIPDRDFTHLLYAYGVRNVGNPELHKAFEKRIDAMVDNLDYPSLFNTIYYLLFRDCADKALWERVIKATLKHEDILPIIYYRPFKASYVYLKSRFPEIEQTEDFKDYLHKFWYAERYF